MGKRESEWERGLSVRRKEKRRGGSEFGKKERRSSEKEGEKKERKKKRRKSLRESLRRRGFKPRKLISCGKERILAFQRSSNPYSSPLRAKLGH